MRDRRVGDGSRMQIASWMLSAPLLSSWPGSLFAGTFVHGCKRQQGVSRKSVLVRESSRVGKANATAAAEDVAQGLLLTAEASTMPATMLLACLLVVVLVVYCGNRTQAAPLLDSGRVDGVQRAHLMEAPSIRLGPPTPRRVPLFACDDRTREAQASEAPDGKGGRSSFHGSGCPLSMLMPWSCLLYTSPSPRDS